MKTYFTIALAIMGLLLVKLAVDFYHLKQSIPALVQEELATYEFELVE